MTPATDLPAHADVAIIGGGFAGLGAAIRLDQEGFRDFLLLERGDDVGGVWHWNEYPGCGCDVPSHLYSFSFAPNPDWSTTYAKQPEIRDYLRRCADRFGVRDRIRTGVEVTAAQWDEDEQRWRLETSAGTLTARVLVSGAGALFEPKVPDLPGLEGFEGRVFHSARWEHDFDPRGKRVAAVGTGASAIQFVPELAPQAAELHVFQRTPPWVMPHPGRPITRLEQRLFRRLPAVQKAFRAGIYASREWLVLGFVKDPRIMKVAELVARRHMRAQISDDDLLDKVQPDYTIGCKRILPSNAWYKALDRPNVTLHTGGVSEVRGNEVVAGDGTSAEVDAIVFGTGFQVTDMPIGRTLRAGDGRTLAEHWRGSMRAHRGTTVPGFPNLFLIVGPNTGLGHGSMVYMIESQVAYLLDALRTMREHGAAVAEVRAEASEAYNAEVDRKLAGTVWSTGCASWYADETGRISTLWPDWTFAFRRLTAEFDADDYDLRAPQPSPEPVAA